MSAYDNDPRVDRHPDGALSVTTDEGRTVAVGPMHMRGHPDDGDIFAVFDIDGTFLGNTGRLDEVLHSLIGDPQ